MIYKTIDKGWLLTAITVIVLLESTSSPYYEWKGKGKDYH